MIVLGILIFAGAFGIASYAIAATILPRLDRIADALAGRPQAAFAPLSDLVIAERRIAVRRWAANSQAPSPVWRAAA